MTTLLTNTLLLLSILFIQYNSKTCFENGGVASFYFDDFADEGTEGKIYFKNDSIIEKIEFGYATSMKIVEQEYLFKKNVLLSFKNKTSYIKLDKSGYISEDSIKVEGNQIFKNENFDENIYNRLLLTVPEKNLCWIGELENSRK